MADSGNGEGKAEQRESADGPGTRLRKARESQDLTIEQMAGELRIRPEALTALERGEFESVGAPVFAKGYLKQYGARLGLDVSTLAADFDAQIGDAGIDIAPVRSIDQNGQRKLMIWVVAGVVLLLIVGLALYWWLGQSEPMSLFESLSN